MNGLLSTALFITEQLLRYAPGLFVEFQKIVAAKDISAEAIRAKRKALQEQTFKQLVPHSEIPPETDTTQAPV